MFKFVINDDLTPHLKTIESNVQKEKKTLLSLIANNFRKHTRPYVPLEDEGSPIGDYQVGFLQKSGIITIESTGEFGVAKVEYTGRSNPKSNRKARAKYKNFWKADKKLGITESNRYTWDYALYQEKLQGFLSEALGDYERFNEIDQVIGAEYLKLLRK